MQKREAILIGFVSIVLLTLAFGSVTQAALAAPGISVSPASKEVSQGETFTIEIVVDPKGEAIYAVQYDLYFDNELLNATSQTRGTLLSQDGTNTIEVINEINNTLGKVEYGETRTGRSGVSNVGVVASISFEVIGASGTSDLKLSNVKLYDTGGTEIENVVVNHGTCTAGKATGKTPGITVEEAHRMLEEKPEETILLDVRTKGEYDVTHIKGAKLIPLSELESRISELNKSKIIIVYCETGGRSRTASETLVQNGFEHVYNMLGGIKAWRIQFPVFALPTPTPAVTGTPFTTPAVSPAASPAPEGKWGIPGFEAITAIAGLLAMSYLLIKRKRGRG